MECIPVSKRGHYVSWLEIAEKLPTSQDVAEFYLAIDRYAFRGEEPVFTSQLVELVFIAIKPIIDADINRRNGGAPVANTNAKKGPTCRKCKSYRKCLKEEKTGEICAKFEYSRQYTEESTVNNTTEPTNNPSELSTGETINHTKTTKTNNVNVNVNDKVKVVEVGSVDLVQNGSGAVDNSTDSTLQQDNINVWLDNNYPGINEKTKDKLKDDIPEDLQSADYLEFVDSQIKIKYQDKSKPQQTKLFIKALLWDDIQRRYKSQKSTKQPPRKKSTIPKHPTTCAQCGKRLTKIGGLAAYYCKPCKITYELDEVTKEWACVL